MPQVKIKKFKKLAVGIEVGLQKQLQQRHEVSRCETV